MHFFLIGCNLLISVVSFNVAYGQTLATADYSSDWLPLKSQGAALSDIEVAHGLGAVPALVEVLVKCLDEPNKDFIFKAIGNAETDDDYSRMFGSVLYTYNEVSVRVLAPSKYNQWNSGRVIYTGESPYWKGSNTQISTNALIKVNCWKETSMPTPCYQETAIPFISGSQTLSDTYREITHGYGQYPDLVKVRAKLTDGADVGRYVDAQGASLSNVRSNSIYHKTGGLKYGYDKQTVRIWASSYLPNGNSMFNRQDGWGANDINLFTQSTRGLVDVHVWCQLGAVAAVNHVLPFGPGVVGEQFEFPLAGHYPSVDSFVLTLAVQATNGSNEGYLFEGVGSAITNTFNAGSPCAYGGLIYAYNQTTIRVWRPDHALGSAICIGSYFGQGTNSQASQSGIIYPRIMQFLSLKESIFKPVVPMCRHFALKKADASYNGVALDITLNVTSTLACDGRCRMHHHCVSFTFDGSVCQTFDSADDTLIFDQIGTKLWTWKNDTCCN